MKIKEHLLHLPHESAELAKALGRRLAGLWVEPKKRRMIYWLAGAVVVAFLGWHSVVRVAEAQVGVLVNNLTGSISVQERVGYHVFVPWVFNMYRLDRRIQTLLMAESGGDGFRGGDAVKVKTSDGSNVALDVQVSYRLLPARAADLLRECGPGLGFGELWVRSAVRAMVAREFGNLTTEQVYDATLRNERAQAMGDNLNRELERRGIEIVAAVPQDFRFYKEYEEVIKNKKLADQEVEEQRAKARHATEEQKKQVAAAEFARQHKVASAQGEADRAKAEADGYAQKARLDAEAALATAEKQAESLLATGSAEAEGMRQAAVAIAGPGGVNLVALEYAKQLQKIAFTGVPVVQESRMGQFRVQQTSDAAAAVAGGKK
jgi:regulator of protease activity HflC (stomatin/prohibitin superfamily)